MQIEFDPAKRDLTLATRQLDMARAVEIFEVCAQILKMSRGLGPDVVHRAFSLIVFVIYWLIGRISKYNIHCYF